MQNCSKVYLVLFNQLYVKSNKVIQFKVQEIKTVYKFLNETCDKYIFFLNTIYTELVLYVIIFKGLWRIINLNFAVT